MSLRTVFEMVLPMFLMAVAFDFWDGVPEQTLMLLVNLLRWFR
jgi:hypothetical protein